VVNVFGAAANPITGVDVEVNRRPGALPGTPVEQELIGAYLGSSSTELYVASPYRARAVYGISWAELAQGRKVPGRTFTAGADGIPAATAFGAAIG
jgi:hypothetical protein